MAGINNRLFPPKSARPRPRSAMGEYQTPPGGRPLSAQCKLIEMGVKANKFDIVADICGLLYYSERL